MRTKRKAAAARPPEEIFYAIGQSELGTVLVATSETGVAAILTGETAAQLTNELHGLFGKARLVEGVGTASLALQRVLDHIAHPATDLDLWLDVRATPFKQKVWGAVRTIPPGETSTYAEIAAQAGSPRSMRAVGNACSTNQFAFAIPCHRVLHSGPNGNNRGSPRQHLWIDREKAAVAGR